MKTSKIMRLTPGQVVRIPGVAKATVSYPTVNDHGPCWVLEGGRGAEYRVVDDTREEGLRVDHRRNGTWEPNKRLEEIEIVDDADTEAPA